MLRVFQRERGLDEVADTRLEKKSDLTLLIKLRTSLHWAWKRDRSGGKWVRRQSRSRRLLSRLASMISGLIHGLGGRTIEILVLMGA